MIARIFLLLIVSATSIACAGDVTQSNENVQVDSALLNNKMQQCLSLIEPGVIQRFNDKGLKLNKTIELLCESNERNSAQNDAIGFALEIQKSKDLSIFKQCAKIVNQDSSIIMQLMKKYFVSDLRYKHICDYGES